MASRWRFWSLGLTTLVLVAGVVVRWRLDERAALLIWTGGAVLVGGPLIVRTVRDAFRGRFATDIVASLSIIAAILLAQPAVALIIVLMLRGGELLEQLAEGRASNAVRALEKAAPRIAHRITEQGTVDVAVDSVVPGDLLLVRPGDVVPCDGVVVSGDSELDTSSLTGEANPVQTITGLSVLSGVRNGLGSFELRAIRPAAESQYARIVELVRAAQADKAPLQRLADRYAVWFTPFTLLVCLVTFWLTRDWMRVLTVLAVATPCPLILATPIAIIGGINRAAQRLVIIKSGGALERLSDIDVIAFDKTGTLTFGTPHVREIRVAPGFSLDRLLAYAAAVERHSSHQLARVIVQAAREAGIRVPASADLLESPGDGITGTVDTHRVHVGSRAYAIRNAKAGDTGMSALLSTGTALTAYVVVDGALAGSYEFEDVGRPDAPDVLRELRRMGLRVLLLSGDDTPTVRTLAGTLGINEYHGDLAPADKARMIEELRTKGARVMMIGDGINDAVALSVADVGVAMAAAGGSISAEAANVVILADSLGRIPELVMIGRRTKRIALQSIRVGLGLSAIGMAFAAFGALTPIAGAAVQEVIDVAVILNALRTSAAPRYLRKPAPVV